MTERDIDRLGTVVYAAAKAALEAVGFDGGDISTGEVAFAASKAFEDKLASLESEVSA